MEFTVKHYFGHNDNCVHLTFIRNDIKCLHCNKHLFYYSVYNELICLDCNRAGAYVDKNGKYVNYELNYDSYFGLEAYNNIMRTYMKLQKIEAIKKV